MSTKTKRNGWLDLILFIVFLVVASPALTGNAIHEWISIVFGITIIVHLLFHWNWLSKVSRKFFKTILHLSRLNYVIDTFFFIALTGTIASGLMISKVVLSTIGIQLAQGNHNWKFIHVFTCDAAVILLGIHLALHWRWLVDFLLQTADSTRRLFRKPASNNLVTQPGLLKKGH